MPIPRPSLAPENTCPDCGEWKNENYETCYGCSRLEAEKHNRVCGCGNFKGEDYEVCFQCMEEEKERKQSFDKTFPTKK